MSDMIITGYIDAGSDVDIGPLDVVGTLIASHTAQYKDDGYITMFPRRALPLRLWWSLSGFIRSARWHYRDHSLRFFLRCWLYWQRHPYWK